MSARSCVRAFTLIELLVVIAILGVLAAMLFPALATAKAKARTVNCLSNLKQLTTCLHLYANDSEDFLPPNNSVMSFSSPTNMATLAASISWCPDHPREDTTPDNLATGVLWQYNRSAAIYRCPADHSTVVGSSLPRQRSYNMSESINGNPDPMLWFIPCWTRLRQPRNLSGAFIFIDENADAMWDSEFGCPTINGGWGDTWWDLPGDRHNQGSNLSFADGHVERWRWRTPKVFLAFGQAVTPEELPDYRRLQNTMMQNGD